MRQKDSELPEFCLESHGVALDLEPVHSIFCQVKLIKLRPLLSTAQQ